jgi:hypothetical protein
VTVIASGSNSAPLRLPLALHVFVATVDPPPSFSTGSAYSRSVLSRSVTSSLAEAVAVVSTSLMLTFFTPAGSDGPFVGFVESGMDHSSEKRISTASSTVYVGCSRPSR